MKIGLIPAPNLTFSTASAGETYVPLGVLCIAAILRSASYDVEVMDPNLIIQSGAVEAKEGFEKEIAKKISARKFEAVGFSSLANSYHQTIKIACALRELDDEVPIIVGGPQATHTDIVTLESFPQIDVIVRGEGELVILDLLKAFSSDMPIEEVPGVTYRKKDLVIRNNDMPLIEDINELPLPAYDLYPVKGRTFVPVDAGRGCPYKCNFCSTCVFWKRKFRQKNPQRIVDEMEILKNGFGALSVDFTHDLFTLDRQNTADLCRLLAGKNLNMPWHCSTRIDAVDPALLAMMKKAGCSAVYYGIESGSDRMQGVIGKRFDTKIVEGKVRETVDAGVGTVASFIIGFPEETEEDLAKTVDMAFSLLGMSPSVTAVQLHILAVTNDTELWNMYHNDLVYDGMQSDQVSGSLTGGQDPFIMKYPKIFPGHFYVRTPHLDRKFLIDLHMLGFVANTVIRWSIVLAARRSKSAFDFVKKWHAWKQRTKIDLEKEGAQIDLLDTTSTLFLEVTISLARYVKTDPDGIGWADDIFRTIMDYERTLFVLKSNLLVDKKAAAAVKAGNALKTKVYPYDPVKIIEWISKGGKDGKELPKVRTKVQYVFKRWSRIGPSFEVRTAAVKKAAPKKRRSAKKGGTGIRPKTKKRGRKR